MNEILKNKLNKFGKKKEPFLFIISYDLKKFYIEELLNLPSTIKFEINKDIQNLQTTKNQKTFLEKFPINFQEYKKKFDILQEEIKAGNSYLLNLTFKTKIKTPYSLDEIYEKTNTHFKLRVCTKDDNFVCFSPEKFIEIKNNKIYTYPMKGTIDTKIPKAKENLLENPKELAEHTMVVDLLRNDLGKIAKNIKVEEFRFVEKINAGEKTLFQTSSKISGVLEENYIENIGDVIMLILPAGSITGTPKIKTTHILENIEEYERDFYTGIFAVFDGVNLNSYVLIRFIEEKNKELFYKSGGGITSDSDALLEYKELIDKIYLPF